MANYKPKTCKQCGRSFTPNASNQTCCSRECRHQYVLNYNREYYRINPQRMAQYRNSRKSRAKTPSQKTCHSCGMRFTPPSPLSVYCTDKCRRAGRQQKQREARAKHRVDRSKECQECESTFTPSSNRQTYCPRQCAKRASAKRSKAYVKQWRARNPDCDKKYYYAHIEEQRERHKRWREANKEHIKQRRREYQAANPDKVGKYVARRAKVELEGSATESLIAAKWEASDHTCILCGQPIDDTLPARHPRSRTLEHLTPISRGGRHDIKRNKTLEEYRAWQASIQQAS